MLPSVLDAGFLGRQLYRWPRPALCRVGADARWPRCACCPARRRHCAGQGGRRHWAHAAGVPDLCGRAAGLGAAVVLLDPQVINSDGNIILCQIEISTRGVPMPSVSNPFGQAWGGLRPAWPCLPGGGVAGPAWLGAPSFAAATGGPSSCAACAACQPRAWVAVGGKRGLHGSFYWCVGHPHLSTPPHHTPPHHTPHTTHHTLHSHGRCCRDDVVGMYIEAIRNPNWVRQPAGALPAVRAAGSGVLAYQQQQQGECGGWASRALDRGGWAPSHAGPLWSQVWGPGTYRGTQLWEPALR